MFFSLFQALCQCGRLKKWAGDERGLVEKEGASRPLLLNPGSRSQLIRLVARSIFRSSSLTENLEQFSCSMTAQVCSVENFALAILFHPGWKKTRNLQTFHRFQGFFKSTGKPQFSDRSSSNVHQILKGCLFNFYLFSFPEEQSQSSVCCVSVQRPVSRKQRKLFRLVKPFLVYVCLKTVREKCIPLKLLV